MRPRLPSSKPRWNQHLCQLTHVILLEQKNKFLLFIFMHHVHAFFRDRCTLRNPNQLVGLTAPHLCPLWGISFKKRAKINAEWTAWFKSALAMTICSGFLRGLDCRVFPPKYRVSHSDVHCQSNDQNARTQGEMDVIEFQELWRTLGLQWETHPEKAGHKSTWSNLNKFEINRLKV